MIVSQKYDCAVRKFIQSALPTFHPDLGNIILEFIEDEFYLILISNMTKSGNVKSTICDDYEFKWGLIYKSEAIYYYVLMRADNNKYNYLMHYNTFPIINFVNMLEKNTIRECLLGRQALIKMRNQNHYIEADESDISGIILSNYCDSVEFTVKKLECLSRNNDN